MSEIIERVAKTISDDIDADLTTFTIASHAIEEMREPTAKMLEAVQNWKGQQSCTDIWKAMVDAALSPS